MSRRSRGKSRFERRRKHAVITKGRSTLVAAAEAVLDKPLLPHQKEILKGIEERAKPQHHALSSVPTRAPCPECGYSQKVKRDGTMGTHLTGKTIADKQCPGTGKRYNA